MAFGKQKSKYYKDDDDFGRKAFSTVLIIALCIIAVILVWKGFTALSYKADRVTHEPQFASYCKGKGYTYNSAQYLKEDGSTDKTGLVFRVTNFQDDDSHNIGPEIVTLYGDGYSSTTWVSDHHVVHGIGLSTYVYQRR